MKKKYFVGIRDCVALEDKVSVKNHKFDFECVETGAEFVTYIEIEDTEKCPKAFSASRRLPPRRRRTRSAT